MRSFAPNDAAGIRALWKVAFFKDFPAAWWQWKYLNNPYGHQMVLCCTEDDQIVGVYSGIPYRAWWQNKVVRLTQLMDIMVHPDYRKDGLFLHLAKTFFDWYAP
ncbi:MAG: GNAT family N-acetyltransferase, partial [Pseudomonadota bacterium]|nr:GNAT family N-acetyltransferase [Pseudomonadota bacterium]